MKEVGAKKCTVMYDSGSIYQNHPNSSVCKQTKSSYGQNVYHKLNILLKIVMADLNFQTPTTTKFEVLTARSLKVILAEPKERAVPLPLDEFETGNLLPKKYYKDGSFDQSSMTCVPLEEIDPAYRNLKVFEWVT